MLYVLALIAVLVGTRAQHQEVKKQNIHQQTTDSRPLQYNFGGIQNAQQAPLPLQFDVSLLDGAVPLSASNLPYGKQVYHRLQPQLLLYAGGAPPGQQFLLQPGSPPGNFLVPQQPQPGPGIVLRDSPQRPLFIAGYPKPAHVPAIEKDAEEIPTDPSKIPRFHTSDKKPEKLETFNEPAKETDKTQGAGEQEFLASADKYPNPLLKKTTTSLKPGQRFFILNGQPLFSNYPFQPYSNNERIELKPTLSAQAQANQDFPLYRQDEFLPQSFEQFPGFSQQSSVLPLGQSALPNYFLRNSVTGQISDVNANYGKGDLVGQLPVQSQNFVSLNQPQDFKEGYLRNAFAAPEFQQYQDGYSAFPFAKGTTLVGAEKLDPRFGSDVLQGYPGSYQISGNGAQKLPLSYFQYDTNKPSADDDSVVVDAKAQNDRNQDNAGAGGASSAENPAEPSISQAQPGAIALAGPGGVAAAAPRGTALVGEGGLAVSSPQATAVAGPSRDEPKRKNKNRNDKQ